VYLSSITTLAEARYVTSAYMDHLGSTFSSRDYVAWQ
jgi:hypothetical protein